MTYNELNYTNKNMHERTRTKAADVHSAHAVGRPKTRKPKPGELFALNLNFDGAVVLALDEEAQRMERAQPGLTITRTDVVRMAVLEWLKSRPKK